MKKQLSWQTWLLIGIAIYLLIPWFIVQSGLLHAAETIPEPALANQSMRSAHNLDQVLDKVEEEQVYLRRLANIRLAVEKELAIVKLIRECGDLDAVCTGQGLALKTPLEEEDERRRQYHNRRHHNRRHYHQLHRHSPRLSPLS